MLVLTRNENERVMVGDDIIVTVVEIRGGRVRLGFEAPGGVPVHREEVWLRVKQEQAVPKVSVSP